MRNNKNLTITVNSKEEEVIFTAITPEEENKNGEPKVIQSEPVTPQWRDAKRLGSQKLSQLRREKIVGKSLFQENK